MTYDQIAANCVREIRELKAALIAAEERVVAARAEEREACARVFVAIEQEARIALSPFRACAAFECAEAIRARQGKP